MVLFTRSLKELFCLFLAFEYWATGVGEGHGKIKTDLVPKISADKLNCYCVFFLLGGHIVAIRCGMGLVEQSNNLFTFTLVHKP